jgi:branched-chain amino acid transport system substrate-binding protein
LALGAALAGTVSAVALAGSLAPVRASSATPLASRACSPVENPAGDLLIGSDLPLQGASRAQAQQMTRAILFVLTRHGWKAGRYDLAYQSCNDATAHTGRWDAGLCSKNATAFANDSSVVGVIGTLNSGCAQIEIPIANRARNGPLVMISPGASYTGLTRSGPGTVAGEPETYYPNGKRNFARLVATHDLEAAAAATLARSLRASKLYVLNDGEPYGQALAANAANAARKLGLKVAGNSTWSDKDTSFSALAGTVRASGAQAVFLGGLVGRHGAELIGALRAGAPNVAVIASDGFTPVSADVAGGGADGVFVAIPGLPLERLPAAGKAFVKAFSASEGGAEVDPYAVYAAQAAEVMVAAIAGSDGTRAGIAQQLFKVRFARGLVGQVQFDADGDIEPGPVTIYRISQGKAAVYSVVAPDRTLVTTTR